MRCRARCSGSSSLGHDGRDRVTSRRLVPGSATLDVERFDRPRDDVKRIGAAHGVRGSLGNDAGDPARHVRRDVGQLRSAFVAEFVVEHLKVGVGAARADPHQMAGVVIDHDDQVAVSALVGDLIDPDPSQPVDAINTRLDICIDPRDDRPDGAPRHPQQLTRRGLRGAHRQPRRQVVEVAGVADTVTSPRHRRYRRAMSSAPDPWRVGFDEHLRRAGVQRPPPPTTITTVVARRTSMAVSAAATSLRVRSNRHDDRAVDVVNCDPFHDRARQPACLLPYLGVQHPVCRPFSFEPSTARNLGIRRGAPADRPSTHPRTEQKSVINNIRNQHANVLAIGTSECWMRSISSARNVRFERRSPVRRRSIIRLREPGEEEPGGANEQDGNRDDREAQQCVVETVAVRHLSEARSGAASKVRVFGRTERRKNKDDPSGPCSDEAEADPRTNRERSRGRGHAPETTPASIRPFPSARTEPQYPGRTRPILTRASDTRSRSGSARSIGQRRSKCARSGGRGATTSRSKKRKQETRSRTRTNQRGGTG